MKTDGQVKIILTILCLKHVVYLDLCLQVQENDGCVVATGRIFVNYAFCVYR